MTKEEKEITIEDFLNEKFINATFALWTDGEPWELEMKPQRWGGDKETKHGSAFSILDYEENEYATIEEITKEDLETLVKDLTAIVKILNTKIIIKK